MNEATSNQNSLNKDDIAEIERLRTHEDSLITERTNNFLVAHSVLIMAISISSFETIIGYPVSILGFVLSIFWIFVLGRQYFVMGHFTGELKKDTGYCQSRVRINLGNFKDNKWYFRWTGHNNGFRALHIMCFWIPSFFLLFWGLIIILLIITTVKG